jgi:Fe-S-cluster-containing dehydrogenase component
MNQYYYTTNHLPMVLYFFVFEHAWFVLCHGCYTACRSNYELRPGPGDRPAHHFVPAQKGEEAQHECNRLSVCVVVCVLGVIHILGQSP